MTVSADVVIDYNANEVVEDLKKLVAEEYQAPTGVTMAFTGSRRSRLRPCVPCACVQRCHPVDLRYACRTVQLGDHPGDYHV